MKYWTVQSKDIMDIIRTDGIFQPDFSKSRYLNINTNLTELYFTLLKAFNNLNNMHLPGLVYAFTQSNGTTIHPIENIDEFHTFIESKKQVIHSFWKMLDKNKVIIILITVKDV